MYQAIFFDVDDTLLNFKLCSRAAFSKTFEHHGLDQVDYAFGHFCEIDKALWAKQRQNLLSVRDVIDTRFQELFTRLNTDINHLHVRDSFQAHLAREYSLEPDAVETIEYLNPFYKLYVASNGMSAMQTSRLKLSKLFPFFSGLYISDDISFEKPDRRFFDETLRRSGLAAHEILFVGDSLQADIAGASRCGMATCWYNPGNEKNGSRTEPNFTIGHLMQLTEILRPRMNCSGKVYQTFNGRKTRHPDKRYGHDGFISYRTVTGCEMTDTYRYHPDFQDIIPAFRPGYRLLDCYTSRKHVSPNTMVRNLWQKSNKR